MLTKFYVAMWRNYKAWNQELRCVDDHTLWDVNRYDAIKRNKQEWKLISEMGNYFQCTNIRKIKLSFTNAIPLIHPYE